MNKKFTMTTGQNILLRKELFEVVESGGDCIAFVERNGIEKEYDLPVISILIYVCEFV